MKIKLLLAVMMMPLLLTAGKDANSMKLTAAAARINEPLSIDGNLSEAAWKGGIKINNLIQRDPIEGARPTEKTEVTILYDDEAIYIGARMFDSHPDSIISRLGRRDDFISADQIYFYVDPYRDKRTGNYFGVNAAGTMYDGILYNDDWNDNSWDGVWSAKVSIDGEGWTAEMKIPYSQLRFNQTDHPVWGVNIKRVIERKNEVDYLVYTPKNGSGFVSRFAELTGIDKITPPGRIEILPYTVGKAEYKQHDAADPFNKGSKYTPDFGADFKIGFGSNLTLNTTVNPDFGQVEVDPAVVNLSDIESFFEERRPFFVEGSSIFNFGYGGARNYWGFNWGNPDMFYSRRVGRAPQGSLPDNDYADAAPGTHILGAAKLTGKVAGGWNLGIISALTKREYADIQYEGTRSEAEIEPLTYYGVARMQKDFNDGHQGFGFMSTYTNRFFKDERLKNDINGNAAVFGIDGWTFLDDDKTWVTTGWLTGSRVTGTKERITDLQRSSTHYFQRPDAGHLGVDSNATSLSGLAGRFYVNKQKGNFFFNSAFGFISPGFDVNDAGFSWRTDQLNTHIGAGYQWTEPGKIFREIELGAAIFRSYDFDGNIFHQGIFHFGSFTLLNYYGANWNLAYNPRTVSNRRTRGGPLSQNYSGWQSNLSINSDNRKDWVYNAGYFSYFTEEGSYDLSFNAGVEWRPASNVRVSFSPEYGYSKDNIMWVTSLDDAYAKLTYGRRYLFAEMEQNTLAANIRLNWTFSPALSLQLFLQPLISSGSYNRFKELARANSGEYTVYGTGGASTIAKDGDEYNVDPDADGPAGMFSFDDPDFNIKSLRGNAVLRWEYLPGSVLYFVWTQSRFDHENEGEFSPARSLNRLVNTRADNVFMVKFTYWFNM